MFAGTPRHLRAQDPARREGAPLVLPREPYDHQPAGRLSGGAPGGHARRSGSGGGCRRGGAEPGGGGERGAPPRGRWRRRASRRDALGAPPGAPRPSRREPRHRAPPRTACPVHRRDGRGAHTAGDRLRAESAACPHRRAAPRTARSVGVPAPPSRGDESQPGAPTQEGPDPPLLPAARARVREARHRADSPPPLSARGKGKHRAILPNPSRRRCSPTSPPRRPRAWTR